MLKIKRKRCPIMMKKLYYGLEVHARKTFISVVNEKGVIILMDEVPTVISQLLRVINRVEANNKVLIIEEASFLFQLYQVVFLILISQFFLLMSVERDQKL